MNKTIPIMRHFFFSSLLLLFLACFVVSNSSCKNETPIEEEEIINEAKEIIEEVKQKKTRLVATIDYLRMREEPGTTGGVLATFNTGDVLFDLGEVSDFTTAVEIRGIKYNEPWLKVETQEGKTGWIYAGGVKFDLKNANDALKMAMQKRLIGLYGRKTGEAIWDYYLDYQAANTDQAFVAAYRAGAAAQEGANERMVEQFPEPRDDSQKPDLSWLEEVMPAYTLGAAAEGTTYYLYKNFKKMGKKAAKTRGAADDDFIELQRLLYPTDGIEYFFPVYFMQTWDYGGHSLLGDGKHLKVLQAANEYRAKHPTFFEEEVEQIREDLINDLVNANGGYWNDREQILKEVNAILAAELGILTDSDKTAIEEFIKRLDDPAGNEIELNMRGDGH